MIRLYTLPGLAFNMPHISSCLTAGYLLRKKINVAHIDLSIKFLDECLNVNYFKTNINNRYLKLSDADKDILNGIETSINIMKAKKESTERILNANMNFGKALNLFASLYNLKWHVNGIGFNYKVTTVDDLLTLSFDESNSIFDYIFSKELNNSSEDIIILSIKYPYQMPFALRLSKLLKEKNEKTKIIYIGDYITNIKENCTELINKCNCIDAIVFNGYQKALVTLINYYSDGKSSSAPNTIYRNSKNEIIIAETRKDTINDINDYIPSFDNLDLNKYLSNVRIIPLILNYGCYHSKCSFCSRYYYYGGYCKLNIKEICKLIKDQYENNKIEGIYFVDECVPPEILLEVSKYLIDNKIKIKWLVETRIEKSFLNKDISKLMYESGCREISFGIESYNKRILKHMKKDLDLKIAKEVMKNFCLNGISVSATFMVNYPTEHIFNTFKTLLFIKYFKYLDGFRLSKFMYLRNSILINKSNIDPTADLNIVYVLKSDKHTISNWLVNKFYKTKKIKKYSEIRRKVLYRTELIYLDKSLLSLNYKK